MNPKPIHCRWCEFETVLYAPGETSSWRGWERLRDHVAACHPAPWYKVQHRLQADGLLASQQFRAA